MLMQTSLRPILVNLAYYNKLKLPLLRGLARLLNLLASWFNVTLGAPSLPHSLNLTATEHRAIEIVGQRCCAAYPGM